MARSGEPGAVCAECAAAIRFTQVDMIRRDFYGILAQAII